MADETSLAAFAPTAVAPAPTPGPAAPQQLKRLSDNVGVTGFEDPTVKQYEFELYSGKTNVTDRIYIVRSGNVAKARTHYHDKLKMAVLCKSQYAINPSGTQETLVHEAACCRFLGAPGQRFAVLIVKYGTLPNGTLASPFTYETRLWKFGADKFIQLRNVGRDFPLANHDLSIYCTDDKYQKLQIGAKPECILNDAKFPAAVRDSIYGWADASFPKLARELGRSFKDDGELMAELQKAGILSGVANPGPAPAMVGPSDAPLAGFEGIIDVTPKVEGA